MGLTIGRSFIDWGKIPCANRCEKKTQLWQVLQQNLLKQNNILIIQNYRTKASIKLLMIGEKST